MIKFQKITKLFMLFLAMGILFSCNDDNTTASFDVVGDVFVTKRIIDDEVKFANSYYAYGNQAMTMAQVTTPVGTEIELNSTDNDGYTYGKTASTSDFTANVPEEGNYAFDVIHEEIQHQAIDLLVFQNLDFTVINTASMENEILVIEWDDNQDAEVYMLRLISEDGNVIFNSTTLPSQTTRFEIDTNTGSGNWLDGYPNNGDTYTLELHAFVFDAEASDVDYTFNIQEVSITEEEVLWN